MDSARRAAARPHRLGAEAMGLLASGFSGVSRGVKTCIQPTMPSTCMKQPNVHPQGLEVDSSGRAAARPHRLGAGRRGISLDVLWV